MYICIHTYNIYIYIYMYIYIYIYIYNTYSRDSRENGSRDPGSRSCTKDYTMIYYAIL